MINFMLLTGCSPDSYDFFCENWIYRSWYINFQDNNPSYFKWKCDQMMTRIRYQINLLLLILLLSLLLLLTLLWFAVSSCNIIPIQDKYQSIFSSHLTKRGCHLNLNSVTIHVVPLSIVRGWPWYRLTNAKFSYATSFVINSKTDYRLTVFVFQFPLNIWS